MVNRDRLVSEFIELVKVDSLSLQERKMADLLKTKIEALGITPYEDDAGTKVGGNAGNIIFTVKGNKKVPAILLMAHMDTVVPGIGKNPVIKGDLITSDGTTILGGDDVAGIESILEALRIIKENSIEHGDIQVAFTIGEEIGLLGAKNMDYSKIYAKYGFVLDCTGSIGTVATAAPTQNNMDITVKGKAAHAGMEPEKGINAIQIASEAIAKMRLGRIDDETTANLGLINGGLARNIVCDRVEIKAEARSRNPEKLEKQTTHMKQCFEAAAEKHGGSIEFRSEREYPAFSIKDDSNIVGILRNAAKGAHVDLILEATGGASDTNIINGKGIEAVDVSIGMDKVHSVEEQISINDMIKTTEFLVEIIKSV